MTRYEFLKSMGFRGAALMAVLTSSCMKEEDTYINIPNISPTSSSTTTSTTPTTSTPTTTTPTTTTPTVVPANPTDVSTIKNPLLTIDLASSEAKSLLNVGGYIQKSSIVVAQISTGVFAAVTQICTHEPKKQIIYSQSEFYCTAHGARFNTSGTPLNKVTSKSLTVYKVATDGKTLVVYT